MYYCFVWGFLGRFFVFYFLVHPKISGKVGNINQNKESYFGFLKRGSCASGNLTIILRCVWIVKKVERKREGRGVGWEVLKLCLLVCLCVWKLFIQIHVRGKLLKASKLHLIIISPLLQWRQAGSYSRKVQFDLIFVMRFTVIFSFLCLFIFPIFLLMASVFFNEFIPFLYTQKTCVPDFEFLLWLVNSSVSCSFCDVPYSLY